MKDLWRIPFTVLLATVYIGGYFLGGVNNLIPSISYFVGWYLFMGLVFCFICAELADFKIFCKLIIFWLPALWIEKVRDWVTK